MHSFEMNNSSCPLALFVCIERLGHMTYQFILFSSSPQTQVVAYLLMLASELKMTQGPFKPPKTTGPIESLAYVLDLSPQP